MNNMISRTELELYKDFLHSIEDLCYNVNAIYDRIKEESKVKGIEECIGKNSKLKFEEDPPQHIERMKSIEIIHNIQYNIENSIRELNEEFYLKINTVEDIKILKEYREMLNAIVNIFVHHSDLLYIDENEGDFDKFFENLCFVIHNFKTRYPNVNPDIFTNKLENSRRSSILSKLCRKY